MKIIKEIVQRVNDFDFQIPFDGKADNIIERGKTVRTNTLLFTREFKKVIETYNLASELGVQIKDVREYITRIKGEYVTKGEVLAERIVRGGLSIKRVLATKDGILSFDRLNLGFLDILSEKQSDEVYSDMFGKVTDVDMNSGLAISTTALSIPVSFSNNNDEICGKFEVLGDCSSIYSFRDLKEEYLDKIVYVGRFAYPDLISKVLSLGAKAVVTFALNWNDLANIPGRVYVVSGFGNIPYHEKYAKFFLSMKGLNTIFRNSSLYWPDIGQYLLDDDKAIIKGGVKINDFVRVLGSENLNAIGKVVDNSNSDGYFTVDFGSAQRALFSEELIQPIKI